MSRDIRQRCHWPMFSSATVPGLLQAYAASERHLPFYTRPDRLKVALADPATSEKTVERLQQGARLMTCLECLEDGSPDALAYMGSLLRTLAMNAFREAEQGGGHE